MLGLGEKDEEVLSLLKDLKSNFVDIVTIGQYLSPGPNHLPVKRFVSPSKFNYFKAFGEKDLNFMQIVSSPLTRSSYHACLLYTSPSPRDKRQSRMPSSA